MDTHDPDDPRVEHANKLYWDSDHSVNQIADELDLSKGTLYGLIRPLSAELACPRCGADMEYPNRTARDRGLLICSSCELEEDEDEVLEAQSDAPTTGRGGWRGLDRRLLGGGLLIAAAGFWVAWSQRRR